MSESLRYRSASESVYAPPRLVTRLDDCEFYHAQDIPGYGEVPGPWDLRGHVDAYLGGVELRGKRVLELGTASGFLCIEMEKRGAEVVAMDLSEDYCPDVVPAVRGEWPGQAEGRRAFLRRINNGWWLVHRAHRSSARVVYGHVYDLPPGIGGVDVATFGSILLHLRDPYRALAAVAPFVRETIIVTDHPVHWSRFAVPPANEPIPGFPGGRRGRLLRLAHRLLGDANWVAREARLNDRARTAEATVTALLNSPLTLFLSDARNPDQDHAWWCLRPQTVCAMLGTLGFTETTMTTTIGPKYNGNPERVFTVVARRK